MDQGDVTLAAIGILTESQRIFAAAAGGEADSKLINPTTTRLIDGIFPLVPLNSGMTVNEAADAVAQTSVASAYRLAAAFAYLYNELAVAHDAGQVDVKSADLLRESALKWAAPLED